MPSLFQRVLRTGALTGLLAACDRDTLAIPNDIANLPAFTLSSTPVFTLSDDGTANRQFTRVSARRLSNGDLAIGDQGSTRIVIFGCDGQVKREVAHKGAGPGELNGDLKLASAGDTLLAFEQLPVSVGTVSVFDATNGFITRISPHAQNYSGRMSLLARLATDTWIVQRGAIGRALYSIPAVGEFMPDSQTLGVLHVASNADSSTVEWLPPFVRSSMVVVPIPGATGANGTPTALPVTFAFKGSTLSTASGDRLWLVNTVTGELTAYDTTGKSVVVTTLSIPARPINQKEIAIARNTALESAKNSIMRASVSGRYDEKSLPRSLPLFSEAIAGADGELWLKVFEVSETKVQQFVIVAREGKLLATAVVPAALRVQHIGRDFVLALSADSLGVESVVEYALRRN